ncbi:pyridoxal-phosphate dependent enzyme [Muricauda sp. SCSIO 64092]|uniref:1-aminocyclopropane-1-carboxylate deaminase/D-cysteine desulfhydrase n=1 Tax=Allomuricauda sp. SCSIO 64092 TaxID=2908842 RepID=UPI001FF1C07A|nr:pyridoxal-phosphate dependent enzyme [Muricauda sp. SCSIO 64092]UOY05061.1 pyridoxal-phosphate dependent enzyme [Muricauda sp. SCSIO 64092]
MNHVPNQQIALPLLFEKQVTLAVKREDLLHPVISGNKYRKLKYNLQRAKAQNFDVLLTFGGAFSNHIAAVACAGKEYGFGTIGVIRGEELKKGWGTNPTLKLASEYGMRFHFVSREAYRTKDDRSFVRKLQMEYGDFYLFPEGGTNALAVKGCEEILTQGDTEFDIIATCVGTGGTMAGLINATAAHQQVLGFPALKGDFLIDSIRKFVTKPNWKLITDYHFGGYAKVTPELIASINTFKEQTGIASDPVYTGKLFFGLLDMIANNQFKAGTKILAIHTGGLQGIFGMNEVLKKKNLPLINL